LQLYEGKAKILYESDQSNQILQYFKDEATAGNGVKKGIIPNKGIYNCAITSRIFKTLNEINIPTHFLSKVGDRSILTTKADVIPLEVVLRNTIAGSLAKRLGKSEGTPISRTILEFYFKNDALGDPMINDDHVEVLDILSQRNLAIIKHLALRVNQELYPRFFRIGLDLIDLKLEFGFSHNGEIILIDEISPDTCRLWDVASKMCLDKDRFRKDLGKIEESYKEVYNRVIHGF
jgi:phosphoribosylaminoimidazole-succinocarboxamide synthase